jgi:hypothetical protein
MIVLLVRKEFRLFISSAKLVIRLASDVFPLSKGSYVAEVQRIAASSVADDAIVAQRLLRVIRWKNQSIYDVQKHGYLEFIASCFRRLIGRKSPANSITVEETEVGKVAFVLTNRTRERLGALGHSVDTVKNMKPFQAIAVVDANIGPGQLHDFLRSHNRSEPPAKPELLCKKNGGYDMSTVRE